VGRRREDLLPIGEIAARSGLATSAIRFYESEGLITSSRSPGNHRLYARHVLRRLAFIRAAQRVGLWGTSADTS
jgi:MerR family redox-sensitive transcriptional activator SoxR